MVAQKPDCLQEFDKIFSLSDRFTEFLMGELGYKNVETMIGATSKRPPTVRMKNAPDIAMVCNPRQGQGLDGGWGRRVLNPLLDKDYNLKVWGLGWSKYLPEKLYDGEFYPYDDLNLLYGSAKIVLNDQHPDMAIAGFVPVRVFDVLASGGFCISEANAGIEGIFENAVPQFREPVELLNLVDFYLRDEDQRQYRADQGMRIAREHTWEARAKTIIRAVEEGRPKVVAGMGIPDGSVVTMREGEAPGQDSRRKVLYVDTLSEPHAACNVQGMSKAYGKVAQVWAFDYRGLANEHGIAKMNDMLVEIAVRFQPDLIHLGKCETVAGAAIKVIKEKVDCCVVHFYGDFSEKPQPWVVDIGKHADCTVFNVTDERILSQYRAAGINLIDGWWGAGTDPEVFYPRADYPGMVQDLVFMGSNLQIPRDGYEKRRLLMGRILDAGLDVHVFGKAGNISRTASTSTCIPSSPGRRSRRLARGPRSRWASTG